jgi:hypothetical protein
VAALSAPPEVFALVAEGQALSADRGYLGFRVACPEEHFCCDLHSHSVDASKCAHGEPCCSFLLTCVPAGQGCESAFKAFGYPPPKGEVECRAGWELNLRAGVATTREAHAECGAPPESLVKGMDWLRTSSAAGALLLLAALP